MVRLNSYLVLGIETCSKHLLHFEAVVLAILCRIPRTKLEFTGGDLKIKPVVHRCQKRMAEIVACMDSKRWTCT